MVKPVSDRKDQPAQPSYESLIFEEIAKRLTFAPSMPGTDFNPLTATAQQLESFKLPPRPDPTTSPHAFANWQRAMSAPLSFIQPESDLRKLFAVLVLGRQSQYSTTAAEAISGNWSGAYIRDDYGQVYTRIQAFWVVPRPYPPPPQMPGGNWLPGTSIATVWIGLDGADPASLSMPQLGTYQQVDLAASTSNPADLVTSVVAWWQWWQKDDATAHQINIPQGVFPLQIGDMVYVELDVINPGSVRFFLKNMSTGSVFPPFDLTQPSPLPVNPNFPVTVEGRTAEWIVERQTKVGTPDLRPFCDYGEAIFHGCTAEVTSRGTGVISEQQLELATLLRMADWTVSSTSGGVDQPGLHNPGIIVSTASLQGNDGVLVTYTGDTP
jgi:hypothetical protein